MSSSCDSREYVFSRRIRHVLLLAECHSRPGTSEKSGLGVVSSAFILEPLRDSMCLSAIVEIGHMRNSCYRVVCGSVCASAKPTRTQSPRRDRGGLDLPSGVIVLGPWTGTKVRTIWA